MCGGIVHLLRTGVYPVVAHHVVGNELRKTHSGIRIKLHAFVGRERELPDAFSRSRSRRENQLVYFAVGSVAGLIKADSAVDQRIIYDNFLALNFATVFDNRQLRPPALGTAIRIIFLAGAIASHRDGQSSAMNLGIAESRRR